MRRPRNHTTHDTEENAQPRHGHGTWLILLLLLHYPLNCTCTCTLAKAKVERARKRSSNLVTRNPTTRLRLSDVTVRRWNWQSGEGSSRSEQVGDYVVGEPQAGNYSP